MRADGRSPAGGSSDPRCPARRAHHLRREGPGQRIPAHRAVAPARGRAERAHRPARRRGVRRVVRLRGADPHPDRRTARGRRPQVHPLPHHGDVRADASGAAHRAQPSHGRDGRHHRAGQRRARLHVDPPQHLCAARRDAEAERLLHRAVRQVPRGAGLGVQRHGPVRPWPTGSGFEHFYGFVGAETNQYYPGLVEGTRHIEPDRTPEEGYHFTEDLTDQAIAWVRQQKALMPDKPFFVYFAPGATHAPHHVPKEWSERYKGTFDQGWDTLREETFARQKQLGVIPPDAELTRRPAEIPAWDDMPEALRPVLARQMEVYAGFLEHTDHHVGRLIDALETSRSSTTRSSTTSSATTAPAARGGRRAPSTSTSPSMRSPGDQGAHDARVRARPPRRLRHPGRLQPLRRRLGPRDGHAVPVDQAGRLALGRDASTAPSSTGPRGIRARGEIRPQFHHVIDVAPTVLEAAGLPRAASWSTGSSRSPTRA